MTVTQILKKSSCKGSALAHPTYEIMYPTNSRQGNGHGFGDCMGIILIDYKPADTSITGEYYGNLSYDVASGSEITPCNKIAKPLVVYRFTGNVMTSIATLHTK